MQKKLSIFNKEIFIQDLETPLTQSYNVEYEIGEGTYSKVYAIRHKKTGDIRVCKYIKKKDFKEEDIKTFLQEIEILKQSDHPNIVKLYEVFETPNSFYLIMEMCNGGNLTNKIEQRINTKKCFEERILSELIRQIASAILYCHKKGICHRDLKPDNLCFSNFGNMENNTIKLIDFGLGKIFDKDIKLKSIVGTTLYTAPEVLNKNYNEKCDIWSLGVILFFLVAGKPPFFGANDAEIKKKILLIKYGFDEEWKNYSQDLKDLISHMLVKEEERYSAQEVLNHRWIKKEKIFPDNTEVNDNQFRIYHKLDTFEKRIIMFIASRLNEKEIKNIKNFFIAFDENNDGAISFENFYNGLLKISSKDLKKEDVQKIFNNIDTDNSGKIEYTEFIASCIKESLYLDKNRLKEIFEAIDKNKTGKITQDDIISVLKLGPNSTQKLEVYSNKLFKDNDGKIDFEQFIKMISLIISEALNKKN